MITSRAKGNVDSDELEYAAIRGEERERERYQSIQSQLPEAVSQDSSLEKLRLLHETT